MGMLSRLPALALAASLAFIAPATADDQGGGSEPPPAAPPPCETNCTTEPPPPEGNQTNSSNSTQSGPPSPPPPSPPVPPAPPVPPPPSPPSQPTQPQVLLPSAPIIEVAPAGCKLVTTTSSPPSVSVNPVLGIVQINFECLLRHGRAAAYVGADP